MNGDLEATLSENVLFKEVVLVQRVKALVDFTNDRYKEGKINVQSFKWREVLLHVFNLCSISIHNYSSPNHGVTFVGHAKQTAL